MTTTANLGVVGQGSGTLTLNRERTLTLEEWETCLCNGHYRMWVMTADWAGNCNYYWYNVEVTGSRRGEFSGGLCKPFPTSLEQFSMPWRSEE